MVFAYFNKSKPTLNSKRKDIFIFLISMIKISLINTLWGFSHRETEISQKKYNFVPPDLL